MSQNRYEVLGKIADGGLGSVFKAYDRNLRREVALKRVRAETPEQAELLAGQLMDEARNLSTLQHPHIVTIYDVGSDEEGAYIIMELLKGETLENIIERGALNEYDFRELVTQSLEGLVAAHSYGMIHLDIKPQNFMVIWLPSGKFQIKILDFGLAKISLQPTVQDTDEEGAIMGSIYFMAPEQFERANVDARTDLYSLGCVYYYALTQHYPFQGETGAEVMASHLYHSLAPLSELRPDLPPFIHEWVEWLINRLPEHRPESAAQAHDVFQTGAFAPHVKTGEVPAQDAGTTRPLAPRPVRAAPIARRPDSHSQELGHRPAPRPIVRPVNIAAAMAPQHLKHKKPWPKSVVLGIPIALAAMAVIYLAVNAWSQSRRNTRFNLLANMEAPRGSGEDIPLLLDFIETKNTSDAAALVLGRIEGAEAGDHFIIQRLPLVKTEWAKKNLTNAVGQRRLKEAVDPLLKMLAPASTPEPEVRMTIWNTLAKISSPADSASLIEKMHGASIDELRAAESALVAIARREPDPARRGSEILQTFRANSATEVEQSALLRALCRIGNKEALPDILKALKGANNKLRYNAALALTDWPSAEPVSALIEMLGAEQDSYTKLNAIISLGNLAPLAGDVPQEEIAKSLIAAFALAKDARSQTQILNSLGKVADPAAVAFITDLAAKDARRKGVADAALKTINAEIAKIVPLAEGATTLQAEQSILTPGPLTVKEGVIINWFGTGDQVSWLIKIDTPGSYEVQISLASAASQQGRYQLSFGRQAYSRQVENTGSAASFKSVTVGKSEFAKPGTYRLWIRPLEIPEGSHLMRLKEAVITRSGG